MPVCRRSWYGPVAGSRSKLRLEREWQVRLRLPSEAHSKGEHYVQESREYGWESVARAL